MDLIRFKINRKRSFPGCLIRESVFIGGKRSSAVKNGGSTGVSVKRERVIFVQSEESVRNNALVFTSGEDEFGLDFRLVGGFKHGVRSVFCPEGSETPLLSVRFDRLIAGLEGSSLNGPQRDMALLVCVMEAFDAEELLRSPHAPEYAGMLKRLGASLYASTFERVLAAQFSGFTLPIEGGEGDAELNERFSRAEYSLMEADENERLTEELARAAANHISAHYNELFTEQDLYRFEGGFDPIAPSGGEKPKKDAPKRKPSGKRIIRHIIVALIFMALEFGLFMLWRYSAYYPERAALENNSCAVTVVSPEIGIKWSSGKSNTTRILVKSEGETYELLWSNTPRIGMDPEAFAEKLKEEPALTLTVKGGKEICAVSGESETYLSVESFNEYQKKQAVMGTVVISVIAFLVLLGLPIALAVTGMEEN